MSLASAQHARHQLVSIEQHVAGQMRSAYRVAQVGMRPPVAAFVARYRAELHRRQQEAHAAALDDSDGGDHSDAQAAARRARVPATWLTDRTAQTGGNVRALQAACRAHLHTFADDAAQRLAAGQQTVRHTARQQVRQALYQAGLASVTLPDDEDEDDDDDDQDGYSTYDGTPLDHLTRRAADRTADGILVALLAGLAAGLTAEALADALWQRLGGAFSWCLTIGRTELATLWRDVSGSIFRANAAGGVVGWTWRATGPNPCQFCLDMDGTEHSLDADMLSHPNCYCTQEPIIAADAASAASILDDLEED